MVSTHNNIVELIEEGHLRSKETAQVVGELIELNKSSKLDFKGKTTPAMKKGEG
jgi:hypothetical protein